MRPDTEVSFLPSDYLSNKTKKRTNRFCSALLLAVIVGTGGAYVWAKNSLDKLTAEHAAVTKQFNEEAERIKRLDELRRQSESILRRAKLADALIEKMPRSEILADIKRAMPEGVALLEFSLDSKQRVKPKASVLQALSEKNAAKNKNTREPAAPPPEPEPPEYDQTVKLVGVAYTDVHVAQFITNLNADPGFGEVTLLLSKQYEYLKENVRRFEIEFRLVPAAKDAVNQRERQLANTDIRPTP